MSPVETLEKQYLRYRRTKAPKDLAPVFLSLAPQLMSAARRAGLDQQGAEDAVQETFLAFIASEEKFEEGRPMIPWVRGIALRQIKAERRRRARLQSLFSSDETADESKGNVGPAELDHVERSELRRKIESAILTLSDGNQKVVSAALLEGLSIEEISQRLNLSRTATSVRLHRGLRRVRKKLGERSSLGLLALAAPKGKQAIKVAGAEGLPLGSIGLVAASVMAAVGAGVWLTRPLAPTDPGRTDSDTIPLVDATANEEASPFSVQAIDGDGRPERRIALDLGRADAGESFQAAPLEKRVAVGMVRSVGGLPALPGAEVFVLRTSPEIVLPESSLVPSALTTEGGTFSLDLSSLDGDESPLLMVRMGKEIGWVDVTPTDLAAGRLPEVDLSPELNVSVVARDELGRPLEGVEVAAFSDVSRFLAPMSPIADEFGYPLISKYRHLFGAVTDQQGIAQIGGLFGRGDGDTGLMVVLTAKKPGYARGMLAYILESDDGLKAEFVLPSVESLRLAGTVVGQQGEPLAGVKLRFRTRGEAPKSNYAVATTDAHGDWEVPNHLLDEFPLFLAFDRPGYTREEVVVIEPTDLKDGAYHVKMHPSGTFEGMVKSEDGAPVAGARVIVATIRSLETVLTDAAGAFHYELPFGVDRSVTVIVDEPGESTRSARYVASRDQGQLIVELPKQGAVTGEFVADLGPTAIWNTASLVPVSVTGTISPIEAVGLDGGVATFDDVPHGEWVLCGSTEAGASVVENLEIGQGEGSSERQVFEANPLETGRLNCVIETDGAWADLSGGRRACTVVMSHRDIPGLPADTFDAGQANRPELYWDSTIDGPLSLEGMLPGAWQVVASGPGWTTAPTEVTVIPGEEVRVDLVPVPACTLSLELPAIARSCLLRWSIRRSADEAWSVVAIPSIATGAPATLTVQVPEGHWQWRVELEADNVGEDFSDVTPPTFGSIDAEPGKPQTLHVLEASLSAAE